MSEEARYFRVGLFLLVGAILTVATIVTLGGGNLTRREVLFETYVDESVQGLEVGSPVKLRGVKIGTVSEIGFVQDYYETSDEDRLRPQGNIVVVRMKVVPRGEDAYAGDSLDEVRAFLEDGVEHGLRLQIAQAGLTGTAFMQADYLDPDRYPPMPISWEPDPYYVPSAPSTFKALSTAAERIFSRLEELDIEGILTGVDALLETTNEKVSEIDLGDVQNQARGLLADLRRTNAMIQGELGDDGSDAALARVEGTLEELQALLASLRRTTDAAGYDLVTTLANLRVVSEDLRDLGSSARAYPSQVLFGDAPPPVRAQEGR